MPAGRFFISHPLPVGAIFSVNDKSFVGQLKNVLRLKEGDEVSLFNGDNEQAAAKIKTFEKDGVTLLILKTENNREESGNRVELYLALLKKENFELATQKATEAGIFVITPVVSKRTVKQNINFGRCRKIIQEAAEQAGRFLVPELRPAIPFGEALQKAAQSGISIVIFDPRAEATRKLPSNGALAIFVGPEGGWTDDELTEAKIAGAVSVGLGRFTLRAETAA